MPKPEAKELHPGRADVVEFLQNTDALLSFTVPHGAAPESEITIYNGGPHTEGGVTLYWTDFVVNEWAEWYSDLATCLVRAACLARSADHEWELFFNDGPEGFVRWSENFFNQAMIDSTRVPSPPANG